MMPRPTKLTREIIQSIAANIYPAGNYFEVACELAGISKQTGYDWMAMAEHRKRRRPGIDAELLSELLDAVNRANAQVESAAVTHWRSAFATDWKAAREYVVRRFPERWNIPVRQEVTGAGGGEITVKVIKGVSMDDL